MALLAVAIAGCSAGKIDAIDLAPGALFEGLIAHWTFDDGPGATVAADSTANHHDGMVLPGTTWLPGEHFGGALRFTGNLTDSEVDVPMFPQPTASWSVAGWVRASAGDTGDTYATIVSTEIVGVGGWQVNLGLAPAVPTNPMNTVSLYQYAFSNGTGVTMGYIFQNCECFVPDVWVHVAGVFDADNQTISLYQGGKSSGSKPAAQTILRGSDTLYFGRWQDPTTRRLIGDLDDFVVYNRALKLPEIQQLSRAPLPAMPPP